MGVGAQLPSPFEFNPGPQRTESCLLQLVWILLPQLTQSRDSLTDRPEVCALGESRFHYRVTALGSCPSVTLPVLKVP